MRKALPALAATLLLAAGAGCGGTDDENSEAGGANTPSATATVTTTEAPEPPETTSTRPEPPPDQSRWASQVDDACAPLQQRIDEVPPPAEQAGLERWLEDVLPLVRKQVAAVEAIKLPTKEEEARRAKLFAAGLHKLENALTGYLAAVRASDPAKLEKAVADATTAGAETRAYALSLGLTECGGYSTG